MTEDQLRELFRDMRDEPVPADSKARVRMAVAERTQSWRERLRRNWKLLGVVLVPACLLLLVSLPQEKRAPQLTALQPLVAKAPAEPVVQENPEPAPRIVPTHQRIAKVRRAATRSVAAVIRIETDDPNIVIMLVGN